MAKASEQFRQSDVTLWGIAALVCAGLAVFGSNVSLMVPQSMLGLLHQPRTASASIETLRQQVADLRQETLRLSRENETLLSRFTLQEKSGSDIVRRVGALEVTVPQMLESLPLAGQVDRANFTASIGDGQTLTFDTEGGSVAVRQSTLPQALPAQPLPAPVDTNAVAVATPNAYGIAIGAAVPAEGAPALWENLSLKLGPLLLGMAPLLTEGGSSGEKRIVVGPIAEMAEARALCERFERVSIACQPMPYEGTSLEAAP